MRKLTEPQIKALKWLDTEGAGFSSYQMGARIGTMYSLEKRDLVLGAIGRWSKEYPVTEIYWQITPEGLGALEALERSRP